MEREQTVRTALGEQAPDLLLQGGRVVNVFTGEIMDADVVVAGGRIAAVGRWTGEPGRQTVDLGGQYVVPGFVDAHCHVESSMAAPASYCREVLRWGTTTLITDPHEIANVAGCRGIRFMLESTASLPVNYYVQFPSCVPATPFEHAGAVLQAEDMRPFLCEPRVLGLGEMMNYPGVFRQDAEVWAKLRLWKDGVLDGHAPGIGGWEIQAYAAAGMSTDHESTTWAEAKEKLRSGISVLIREGSACKNLEPLVQGLLADGADSWNLAFCTDDKHLSDIRREGTIRWNVRRAVELGMDPVEALRIATIQAARIYGLKGIGAVAPGYRADLVVVHDLKGWEIDAVYKDGVRVDSQWKEAVDAVAMGDYPDLLDSVHIAALTPERLALPDQEEYPVLRMVEGNVTTLRSRVRREDLAREIARGHLRKLAVIERHHATGHVGVGLIEGYGLSHGAVATTVAHDSHNLIVLGDNDGDMCAAAGELVRIHGGYAIVRDGRTLGSLPLPVAGLMSDRPVPEVIDGLEHMLRLAHDCGVNAGIDPFTTLSFMALPVIPELRVTDMGVFDVTAFRFVTGSEQDPGGSRG